LGDCADRRVARNINQPGPISATQRRISSRG
jgi:hypothetical protein